MLNALFLDVMEDGSDENKEPLDPSDIPTMTTTTNRLIPTSRPIEINMKCVSNVLSDRKKYISAQNVEVNDDKNPIQYELTISSEQKTENKQTMTSNENFEENRFTTEGKENTFFQQNIQFTSSSNLDIEQSIIYVQSPLNQVREMPIQKLIPQLSTSNKEVTSETTQSNQSLQFSEKILYQPIHSNNSNANQHQTITRVITIDGRPYLQEVSLEPQTSFNDDEQNLPQLQMNEEKQTAHLQESNLISQPQASMQHILSRLTSNGGQPIIHVQEQNGHPQIVNEENLDIAHQQASERQLKEHNIQSQFTSVEARPILQMQASPHTSHPKSSAESRSILHIQDPNINSQTFASQVRSLAQIQEPLATPPVEMKPIMHVQEQPQIQSQVSPNNLRQVIHVQGHTIAHTIDGRQIVHIQEVPQKLLQVHSALPPSIISSINESIGTDDGKKTSRRVRTTFSQGQKQALESAFGKTPYPDASQREQISIKTQIPEARVQVCINWNYLLIVSMIPLRTGFSVVFQRSFFISLIK